MKTNKNAFYGLSILALAFAFSACSQNAAVNNVTANTANKSNAAIVVNSNQTAMNKPASSPTNAATSDSKTSASPAKIDESDMETIQGELQTGKTESVILYFGEESGDYAAYCFTNDSEAGRTILEKCKDREQCEVKATTGEGACKVPGLEADLSASAKILKVGSVKSRGSKK